MAEVENQPSGAGKAPKPAAKPVLHGKAPLSPSKLSGYAPPMEVEPEIIQGVDLSGQPKIIFGMGRGKTGKTTLLRWFTEIANSRNGRVLLADIDPNNASFSHYFNDVARPDSDHPIGVARWLQEFITECLEERASAIIDLGGGDTTLRTLATELPGLAETLEASGVAPILLHTIGTQPEDLTPCFTLKERGFDPKAQAFILNEFGIEPGMTRERAFERVFAMPEFQDLLSSHPIVWMPRLFAATEIEQRECTFFDARDGKIPNRLNLFDAARVRIWLNQMDQRFEGIKSWIP